MQNKDMIIRPAEFYKGIEDLVTPELFFERRGQIFQNDKLSFLMQSTLINERI